MLGVDLRRAEEGRLGDVRALVKPPEESLKARRIPLEVDPPRDGPDMRRHLVQPGNKRPSLRREVGQLGPPEPKRPVERPDQLVPRIGMDGEGAVIGHTGVELVAPEKRLPPNLLVPPLPTFGTLPPRVDKGVLNPPNPTGIVGMKVLVGEVRLADVLLAVLLGGMRVGRVLASVLGGYLLSGRLLSRQVLTRNRLSGPVGRRPVLLSRVVGRGWLLGGRSLAHPVRSRVIGRRLSDVFP
ncbi:hypothetical protein VA596_09725 [Amycolatopsis sp., V23-08]|uniref:Uncharacterized protein n=1 Tax=Amycolatopsis heterodermiae TaxID=3110235 RepID=A0ABU5R0V8_9PSEU|nr:hypothetical protein [Amycolatopsis sp., V23-08]MEA5359816.1 hypothetical protein [Amycolatopsis sp., V23-08]